MAEKKFSELTAKGATIADTDIVAISESAGGGTYTSKSVTGANIKALVTDANMTTTDITTNDVSTSKHGFAPKAPNDATKFLDGTGAWSTPAGGGGSLTVGTTSVTSGTIGRIFFQGSGDVLQQDSTLFWDNTNKRLGIGATPSTSVRLDVRAQGALSTDVAFRVRNSANTIDFLVVNGAGDVFNRGAGGFSTNAFFGEDVGRSATGQYNAFFGNNAAKNNTSGNQNSFFGFGSGQANTSGANNTFLGTSAGNANTSASNNSFIGTNSGLSNTTGTQNSFVGAGSGQANQTGGYNAFFGHNSGTASTSSYNAFFGWQSGLKNTSGNQNIFFGASAGVENTTGSDNSFLGTQAGGNNTTGGRNTFMGSNAGYYISSGGNLTVSSNSVFIGYDTRANASSETNQIVIGYEAIGLGSNTAVLGNSSIVTTQLRGSVISGNQAALATTATDGFLYIPSCAGTPTGTPTSITGKVPMVADTTNNKLYIYVGGAWTAMN